MARTEPRLGVEAAADGGEDAIAAGDGDDDRDVEVEREDVPFRDRRGKMSSDEGRASSPDSPSSPTGRMRMSTVLVSQGVSWSWTEPLPKAITRVPGGPVGLPWSSTSRLVAPTRRLPDIMPRANWPA